MKEHLFYVYLYLRKDMTPYYVGKGSGDRVTAVCHRIKPPKDKSRILIKECLSESEAFDMEKYLIALYGRKDLGTGILRNMTDGGEGCVGSARPKSEGHRRKLSIASTGKKQSEETIQKRIKSLMGNKSRTGQVRSIDERMKGSESLKRAYQEGRRAKGHSDETKRKISETLKGRKPAIEFWKFRTNYKEAA